MATFLSADRGEHLNFTSGTILVLTPASVFRTPSNFGPFALYLLNQNGDILLQISFSTRCIACRDRGNSALGWGEEQTVDMKGRSVYGDRVSVHHYLTDTKFGRYHIALNGITVCHFDKRFPGPAIQISYKRGSILDPPCWGVDVVRVDDLLPDERLALLPGR